MCVGGWLRPIILTHDSHRRMYPRRLPHGCMHWVPRSWFFLLILESCGAISVRGWNIHFSAPKCLPRLLAMSKFTRQVRDVIKAASPLKTMQEIAREAQKPLSQVRYAYAVLFLYPFIVFLRLFAFSPFRYFPFFRFFAFSFFRFFDALAVFHFFQILFEIACILPRVCTSYSRGHPTHISVINIPANGLVDCRRLHSSTLCSSVLWGCPFDKLFHRFEIFCRLLELLGNSDIYIYMDLVLDEKSTQ